MSGNAILSPPGTARERPVLMNRTTCAEMAMPVPLAAEELREGRSYRLPMGLWPNYSRADTVKAFLLLAAAVCQDVRA